MAAAQQQQGYGPWQARPRQRASEFEPLPVKTSIPGLKTLEADLQEQVTHCNEALQADLDYLHEQVITEVHSAVSQELHAVAQRLSQMEGEIRRECSLLLIKSMSPVQQEVEKIKAMREQDRKETSAAIQTVEDKASQEALQNAEKFHEDVSALETQLQDEVADILASKFEEESAARQEQNRELGNRLEERIVAVDKQVEDVIQDLRRESEKLETESSEGAKLRTVVEENRASLEQALSELTQGFQGEAMVGEARFRESQAMVAELEQRLQATIREAVAGQSSKSEEMEIRAKYEMETLREGLGADVQERLCSMDSKLQQLNKDCLDEIGFAHAAWTRQVEWNAEVNLEVMEREGRYEASGPVFTAAGLRPLQLQLRLVRLTQDTGKPRWACGVYLQCPHGKVTFRISIAGRTQSFTAEFGETPEWGSNKVVVLERVPQRLAVNLEILDVVAPVSGNSSPELTSTLQMTDASQVASREVASLRATMVRRVEWRISRVSERLAAARESASSMADDEALEPLVSPQFAAAGFEGLVMHLYPLGYRPRGDEACGFFITCPRGLYVKCRAFIGDQVRIFEHQYDSREPYGRGSFCRLADRIDSDDCITCGIEFIEVRQELTTQVRGGPFGNVADQLKLINNPSVNGMEIVRELKDLNCQPERSDKRPPRGPSRKSASARASSVNDNNAARAAPTPRLSSTIGPSLQESKSLPSLLPAVPHGSTFSGSFGMNSGSTMQFSSTRQMDTLKCR